MDDEELSSLSHRRRRRQLQGQLQGQQQARLTDTISDEGEGSDEAGGNGGASIVVSRVNVGVVSIEQLRRNQAWNERVEQMNLFGNSISSMDGLHAFTSLQELCLSNNQLEELSFHALDPLKLLRVLDISANSLSTLRGLPLLPRLQELSVAHNRLTILEGLLRPVKLPKLRYLDLRGNQIASPVALVPLQHQKRLTELRLQSKDGVVSNPICDQIEYPDALLEFLPTLKRLDEEDTSFLQEVSRVRMPKYHSLVRRMQGDQPPRRPGPGVPSSSPSPSLALNAAPVKASTKGTQEMRVFVEDRKRLGYSVNRSTEQQHTTSETDAENQSERVSPTEAAAPPPPTVTVQRIVLREASTNTEMDMEKSILTREALLLEQQASMVTREKEFLQKETDFFAKERDLQDQIRQLQGQLASAMEQTAKADARATNATQKLEDKVEELEQLHLTDTQNNGEHVVQIKSLRDEITCLSEANGVLQAQLNAKEEETRRREEDMARTRLVDAAALQEAVARAAAVEDKLKEKSQQLHDYELEAEAKRTADKAQIDKLSQQLSQATSQNETLKQQNEFLERQFHEMKTSRDQYRDECLHKDDDIYRLKKALSQKAEEMEETKVLVMKANERQDRMQQQQQQLYEKQLHASVMQLEMEFRREHQTAMEKLQIANRKYQESMKQHLRLKASYESSLKREGLLKDEVQRLSAVLEGDKQRLVDQETTKRAEYEFKIQQLQDDKQALHDELLMAKDKRLKASALQEQLEKQRQECERLREEIKKAGDVIFEWEKKEGDWKAALKVKDTMLDDQLRQLDELRKQNNRLEQEYQQDTGEFQAQIEDLEETLDSNIEKLSSLQEKYARIKTVLSSKDEMEAKQTEKIDDLKREVELKNAAMELIEGEMDRMRELLTKQDELFQKRLQKHLDAKREEQENIQTANEEVTARLRDDWERERTELTAKYDALANDLKDMAAQNTKLRVSIDQERKKNQQSDRELRVLLSQLDRERQVKNERLNDIKRLFDQLQQETP